MNAEMLNDIILTFVIVTLSITTIIVMLRYESKKNINDEEDTGNAVLPVSQNPVSINKLAYSDVIEIIDTTAAEIIQRKYILQQKITGAKAIRNVETMIQPIALEIIDSFSPEFIRSANMYISSKYIIEYVTRFVKIELIRYNKEQFENPIYKNIDDESMM